MNENVVNFAMAIKPLYLILDTIWEKKNSTKKEICEMRKTAVWPCITHRIRNISLYSIKNYGKKRQLLRPRIRWSDIHRTE
jgi:hypothetical protein